MTDSVQAVPPASDVPVDPVPSADPANMATPADATSAPTADTVPPTGQPGQSPLDVLDQILKDAQTKSKAAVDEKSAEEAAKIAAERERQKKLDEDRVRQQLLGISQVKESPEYQKMQEMQQAVEQKQDDYTQKMDGMQILQLEHTKI